MRRLRRIRMLFPLLALVTSWALPPDHRAAASWPIPIDLPPELLAEVDAQVLEAEVELIKTAELEGVLMAPRSGTRQPLAYRYTPSDVHAALRSASPRAACIIRHEVGGWGYDPYAVGSQGELGAAQLHPRGLLSDFYRRGFTDPFNPYQALAYLEYALVAGMARNWSPALRGLC